MNRNSHVDKSRDKAKLGSLSYVSSWADNWYMTDTERLKVNFSHFNTILYFRGWGGSVSQWKELLLQNRQNCVWIQLHHLLDGCPWTSPSVLSSLSPSFLIRTVGLVNAYLPELPSRRFLAQDSTS